MAVRKAVITAAGWGTRFLPVTKSQPKEMLPLVDKPLIQYSVEEAVACGADLVVIVVSPGKNAIREHFSRSHELETILEERGQSALADQIRRLATMADIVFVEQRERLGLGHALLMAKHAVGDEPFMLLLPDDLFEKQESVLRSMIAVGEQYRGIVVAVARVAASDISRYGVIRPRPVFHRVYEVLDLVEKPRPSEAPSDMAIMGRYFLAPEIFQLLEDTPPGRNGEIQLTDALRRLRHSHRVLAYEFEGERYDAGTPLGWLKTTFALASRNPEFASHLRECLEQTSDRAASSMG